MVSMAPTPSASLPNDLEQPETWLARREEVKAKGINGNGMGMPLAIYAKLAPTPTATDAKSSRNASAVRSGPSTGNAGTTLTDFVDPTNGGRLLPTPTSSEHKYRVGGDSQQSNSLGGKAARGDLGQHQPGRTGGVLNPTWVEWLMGFPSGWTAFEPSETP